MQERKFAENKVKILIVDDKKSNIVALEAILSSPEYNLVTATSGTEALRHVLNEEFAVILLDVMMPEIDGFEIARLIKRNTRSAETPIIFLTAIAKDQRYIHEGYAVGAVDYLHKPLEAEIVQAKVAVFVELYRKNERIKQQEILIREAEIRAKEQEVIQTRLAGERHYRNLAESIPQIVWTSDAEGNVTYLNKNWFSVTGLTAKESYDYLARIKACHPDDATSMMSAWDKAKSEGTSFECEVRLWHVESQVYRWYIVRALPERNDDDQVVAWHGTCTDIHLQKRSEQEQRFLAVASGILASSLDYRKTIREVVNLSTPELSDLSISDILIADQNIYRVVACGVEQCQSFSKNLESQVKGMDDAISGFSFALKDAKPVIINDFNHANLSKYLRQEEISKVMSLGIASLMSTPIILHGELAGALTSINFDSERRFNEMDLKLISEVAKHIAMAVANANAHNDLIEANRIKDEFLATLSHELRTPLNAVIGWSDLLKSYTDESEVLNGLGIIERNGRSLLQLVTDLLDVSRIIAGRISLDIAPVDLNSLILRAVENALPSAENKNISLKAVISESTPIVNGDIERLHQIMWNLLSNAIKFTPCSGEIIVSLEVVNKDVKIHIRDNGSGITPEILPHIFERFRQADSSTTRRFGGLGLGLAIVKHLVELHGGVVYAHSAGLDRGSTFSIELPVAQMEARSGATADAGSQNAKSLPSLSGVCVVVVDDDEDSRLLAAKYLSSSGATVQSAADVEEAIRCIRELRPDIVLTDLAMPGEGGFDLVKKLDALQAEIGKPIQAAAFTAFATLEDERRAIAAGFKKHIAKPVKVSELVSAIASLSAREGELPS